MIFFKRFKPGPTRTIFIGDVHGCIDELKSLLKRIKPTKKDRIIFLGDLVNRGPNPSAVINLVFKRGYECIKGNHELDYLQRNATNKSYAQIRKRIGEKAHRWLEDLPLFIEGNDFIAVHGGVIPETPIATTDPRILTTIRTWDGKGENLKNPTNPAWHALYQGKKLVVYGHWAGQGLHRTERTICIDSGCVYGGKLTAYHLEANALTQVNARRVYQKPTAPGGRPE